jgi:hypothetical protein
MLQGVSHFEGQEVIVTEKLDGENTSIYADKYCHARSTDSKNHESRKWIKRYAETIANQGLPEDMRVCGENLYAQHSLAYDKLKSYFYYFGIYRGDKCLSWDETVEWGSLLGMLHAPVLYRGVWDESLIRGIGIPQSQLKDGIAEGYVVRVVSAFSYDEFDMSCAKYVRAGHVQTSDHWMHQQVIPNRLES